MNMIYTVKRKVSGQIELEESVFIEVNPATWVNTLETIREHLLPVDSEGKTISIAEEVK